jgi:hypothetical protein
MKRVKGGWRGFIKIEQRDAAEEVALIQRDGLLRATSGVARRKPLLKNDVIDGTYVPDTANIHICLHCPLPECKTGNCYRLRKEKDHG